MQRGGGIAVASVLVAGLVARASAGSALDRPAFTATPAELLADAKAAPRSKSDADVIVLRDETTLVFDDAGRAERRRRIVYVVEKQQAVDGWGTVALDFQPFYQDRPTIRARVVSANGQVAEIDQSLITDSPKVSESPNVFSDRREMTAPLPRLAVGAVVEELITTKDRETLLASGTVAFAFIGHNVPIVRTIVTISLPTARSAHVVTRGFVKVPVAKQTVRDGRTTWSFDLAPMEPLPSGEAGVPGDIPQRPFIAIATGRDWGAIAADYRKLVEQRIAQGPIVLPAEVKGANQGETLRKTVAWLHAHVRYTGIELSDAAIIPWPPNETLKRGFGDCKDKATLLVALLRAAGIDADLALLSTGPGLDIDRELPGMGDFDHAIVRAKIDGRDVWVDATEARLPPGQLPPRDQGRRALIIAAGTHDLTPTPMATSADNMIREVRTFHAPELNGAAVTETTEERGVFWDGLRGWIARSGRDVVTKDLTKYAENTYEGELASFDGTDPPDITQPARFIVSIKKSHRVFTARNQIDAYFFPSDVLTRLPSTLADRDADERRLAYEWSAPFMYEIENRIEIPPGHTIPQLQPRETLAVGTMTLTTQRRIENDTLVVSYLLDTGKLRLTASELVATRKAIGELRGRHAEHIMIVRTAIALLKDGKAREAVAEVQRMIALHPKEALHYDQLADLYAGLGLGSAARRIARKGVEIEPTSGDAHFELGIQLRRDTLGRTDGFDSDRKGALAEFRKALQLAPTHRGALSETASFLTIDADGTMSTNRANLLEAAALWRRANDVRKNHDFDEQIANALWLAGEVAEVERMARAMPDSSTRSTFLVVTTAVLHGAKDAISMAATLGSDSKRLLLEALTKLQQARRYDLVRELFDAVKGPTTPKDIIVLIANLKPVELAKLDPADPITATIKFVAAAGGLHVADPPWDSELGKQIADGRAAQRDKLRTSPAAVAIDQIVGKIATKVEGDASTGWRVEFGVPSAPNAVPDLPHEAARSRPRRRGHEHVRRRRPSRPCASATRRSRDGRALVEVGGTRSSKDADEARVAARRDRQSHTR